MSLLAFLRPLCASSPRLPAAGSPRRALSPRKSAWLTSSPRGPRLSRNRPCSSCVLRGASLPSTSTQPSSQTFVPVVGRYDCALLPRPRCLRPRISRSSRSSVSPGHHLSRINLIDASYPNQACTSRPCSRVLAHPTVSSPSRVACVSAACTAARASWICPRTAPAVISSFTAQLV